MPNRFLHLKSILLALLTVFGWQRSHAQAPEVVAFYTAGGEPDHIEFARQAIAHFTDLAAHEHFRFRATTDWSELEKLSPRSTPLALWLNDRPHTPAQRAAFERYMNHGGGWLGFHVSAYNDSSTQWPWFVAFLGGGIFHSNNWPPLPAQLHIDDPHHPVTRGLPANFLAPANEWYLWQPSPRLNHSVKVLVTLDPANFPLGLKDTITAGDMPIVWTNTHYRMIYANMGHGDKIFTSPTQNLLFDQALLWLLSAPGTLATPAR
jgi:type 1 glutamine amidotransferase